MRGERSEENLQNSPLFVIFLIGTLNSEHTKKSGLSIAKNEKRPTTNLNPEMKEQARKSSGSKHLLLASSSALRPKQLLLYAQWKPGRKGKKIKL